MMRSLALVVATAQCPAFQDREEHLDQVIGASLPESLRRYGMAVVSSPRRCKARGGMFTELCRSSSTLTRDSWRLGLSGPEGGRPWNGCGWL